MSPLSVATPDRVAVLVADSTQMQSQLLTSALRRHPEFNVVSCAMESDAILNTIQTYPAQVVLMTTDHHNGGVADMGRFVASTSRIRKYRKFFWSSPMTAIWW